MNRTCRHWPGDGTVELILITHRHADHTAAAARFSELTGAPVRAADPAHCHGAPPLKDGETILAAGVEIRVLATPGHTSDSLCFHLPQDGPHGSVLTGDTILGSGTTVLDYPDGTLRDYLESLDRLERLGPAAVLPAHGPVLPALDAVARAYRDHRQGRLAQVRAALESLGADAGVERRHGRRVRRRRSLRPPCRGTLGRGAAGLPAQRAPHGWVSRYAWSHAYRPVCS